MKDCAPFLFEIGCEEIPAGVLPKAAIELKEIVEKTLEVNRLLVSPVSVCAAPRRLVAMSNAVMLSQEDERKEVLGPPKSVAFDNVGQPTRAAESFSEKQGVPISALYTTMTPRGEYLAARLLIRGRAAREILAEALPRAMKELGFPRSMYWTGKKGARFVRPVRWLVALLRGEVIPFDFEGVTSGDATEGHRFLGRSKIRVRGPKDYVPKLRRNFVLVDPADRRKKIEREIRSAAVKGKWQVREDTALLNLVIDLNEYPTVIRGDFDSRYLELPSEVIVTVMRDHQKYFALENREGEIAPHFVAVINLDKDRAGLVRRGHEKVLRARLADAEFFWQSDQKCRLADYAQKLAHITFESRLGSYRDKTERMCEIARKTARNWFDAGVHEADVGAADRAAQLAKCDLATEMVREFTELQGIMGGLYARAQGEDEEVAWAVYDHYKPIGTEDTVPRNLTGCVVSIADKLDSLVACFAAGIVPSGSSDPFALRRAASGIVQILLERSLPLSLSAAISTTANGLRLHPPKFEVSPEVEKRVLEFIFERAKYLFREKYRFAYDEVNAAMVAGADDLVDVRSRIVALRAIRHSKNFEPLAVAFRRIRKILEKAGPDGGRTGTVNADLLRVDAERILHREAQELAGRAGKHKRAGNYKEALEAISELRPAVDRFFDDVLVMDKDEAVRRNRLALLASLLREFSTIADFAEMAEETKS
ncbi:MAG TPA: glycine--tRNA ligase subunit beta [Candidatus Acidoferrales bacterium]|nr:glycine--tRNA ligase subunit beta [Candidatus Acidoferrales bacterium]